MFERALKKVPGEEKLGRAECYNMMANCHSKLGEFPLALSAAIAATEQDKTSGEAWLNRGWAHGYLQQWAEAVSSLDTALDLVGLDTEDEAIAQTWLQR